MTNEQAIYLKAATNKAKDIKIYIFLYLLLFLFIFISPELLAADDVFDKVNTKGTSIAEGLQGIAGVIATIVIMIASIASYKGRLANEYYVSIVIASVVIGAAGEIAVFLTS
jgi:hypothetical protein